MRQVVRADTATRANSAPSAVDLLRRLEGEPDTCTRRGAAA
jgi:hypothetical protein